MASQDDLTSCAPRLCRFARALAAGRPAPNKTADDLVHTIMQRTLEAGDSLRLAGAELHLHLYSRLVELHRERLAAVSLGAKAHREKENSCARGPRAAAKAPFAALPRDKFAGALLALSLEEREALLLVVLEGFSYAQAARILKISRTMLLARLARARAALDEILAPESVPHPGKVLPSYLRVVK